jgi:hypothetical protein
MRAEYTLQLYYFLSKISIYYIKPKKDEPQRTPNVNGENVHFFACIIIT